MMYLRDKVGIESRQRVDELAEAVPQAGLALARRDCVCVLGVTILDCHIRHGGGRALVGLLVPDHGWIYCSSEVVISSNELRQTERVVSTGHTDQMRVVVGQTSQQS